MTELRFAAKHLWYVSFLAIVGWNLLMVVYILVDKPILGDPTGLTGDHFQAAPAVGLEGYDTYLLCKDPLTKVTPLIIPDSGGGYQLTRTRDGISEVVTVVFAPDGSLARGTHYADGVPSETAYVTSRAQSCIDGKLR